MKKAKYLALALLVLSPAVFAVDVGTVVGGAIGGGAGAAIGQKMGGTNGAIVGAAIGGATGAVIGSNQDAQAQPAARPLRTESGRAEEHDRGHHYGDHNHGGHSHGESDGYGDRNRDSDD